MTNELVALLDGNEVGRVRNDARGRLTFVYDSVWRGKAGAYPLSLSMPLMAEKLGPAAVAAFLWGLLPDNERVLDRWAKKFQVSAEISKSLEGRDCSYSAALANSLACRLVTTTLIASSTRSRA